MEKSKNRVPFEYFVTKGQGCSNLEVHAGSYHMALHSAGISDYNIQTYSSILPKISKEIKKEQCNYIPFGSELYTIMSCIHGSFNEYISCGIIIGDLIDYKSNEKIGSLVCEVSGNYDEHTILEERLNDVLNDLYEKTYKNFKMKNIRLLTNSYVPTELYGTCIVALCFVSFV